MSVNSSHILGAAGATVLMHRHGIQPLTTSLLGGMMASPKVYLYTPAVL